MGWGTKTPPKNRGRYLVTVQTSMGRQVRQADREEYPPGNWYWNILPSGGNTGVVAWMKEPKPILAQPTNNETRG